jgi:hypothetical protein
MPSLGIIVNGRTDLAGPLANYGLGRSGAIYVVAAGKANNAGEGSWAGCGSNYCTVGIEAENDGYQPWPTVQLDAYAKLSAVILERLARDTAYLCGHKEWAPGRKVDPHSIDMDRARATVQSLLDGGDDMPWKKPGDPIENVKDADAALANQGGLLTPGPLYGQASYNPSTDAEANDRIWIVLGRVADLFVQIDTRLRKIGG